jgi:ssDNA-binding Zn-finger/Zn-ribbon topoisomerase 1
MVHNRTTETARTNEKCPICGETLVVQKDYTTLQDVEFCPNEASEIHNAIKAEEDHNP